MKVPPKRKGNATIKAADEARAMSLNESPSEKEGKSPHQKPPGMPRSPSMKVPPKRKGNLVEAPQGKIRTIDPSMKVPPKRKGNERAALRFGEYKSPQ